jgi:hypothetical protein
MNNSFLTCNANGYGKSNNCPTLGYVPLCHYLKRWLLTSSLHIQNRRLCVHVKKHKLHYILLQDVIFCLWGRCYFS